MNRFLVIFYDGDEHDAVVLHSRYPGSPTVVEQAETYINGLGRQALLIAVIQIEEDAVFFLSEETVNTADLKKVFDYGTHISPAS